jgi:hypothetical protein
MYGINYSHQWETALPKKETWMLLERAFINSGQILQWPHDLIDIRSDEDELSKDSELWFIYKFGAVYKTQHPYVIRQIIPGQRIVYDTAKDHPLAGKSVIEITDGKKPGTTKIRWSGRYDIKSFSSTVTLLFYKFYYDPRFFEDLEHATNRIRGLKKSKHSLSLVA